MLAVSPSSLSAFLLVVAHLVILNFAAAPEKYQLNCPESFNFSCGSNTTWKIVFPFTTSSYPGCGPCIVKCFQEGPRIQLVSGGEWYPFKEIGDEDIIISNDDLRELRISRSCDLFIDRWLLISLFLPVTSSITYNTNPPLNFYANLLKCSSSGDELNQQIADYFRPSNYYSYQGCSGFTVYYRYPPTINETSHPLPNGCVLIQLPMLPSTKNTNASDVFSILDDYYYVQLEPSARCQQCHDYRGQCSDYPQGFHCLKDDYSPPPTENIPGSPTALNTGANRRKLILGIVIAGVLAAGIVIVILFFCRCRSDTSCKSMIFWKKKNMINQNVEVNLKKWGLAPKRYSYSDIKKMTCSFKKKLGQGGYGTVYKGNFKTSDLIAVKVLKKSRGNVEEFINEVTSIGKTSHINIVTLLGFCLEGNKRALVYEFMPNGSLEKFMHDENSSAECQLLGWETLYQIAIGIARGLEYLHRGCNTRILHLDIKPQNILLDEDFCPKISDFGLAKICPKKESIVAMSGMRGTAGYIAPEIFSRNFGGVSHKSDVYSYGMMLLNMVIGRKNIDDRDHSSEQYFPDWIYRRLELSSEIEQHGIMNGEENEKTRKMIIVGLWCVQINPSDRPAMSRVLDMLEGSLESLQIPPRPFFSSPPRTSANISTDTFGH